ncbi:division abnormally delayed protein [Musca domestica]|uniref:Division abnormally delayed protein n=1 Tax=Musca domestica TaxID=7370 RepID=A0ABM3VPI9_MUSDO|nr:division abnormally delayed protein [Musca domestica]
MALKPLSCQNIYNNSMKLILVVGVLATILVASASAKSLDFSHDLDTANSYLEAPHHHQASSLHHHQSHSLHHHNRNRRLQRRDSNSKDGLHCNDVRGDFEAIDIPLPQHFNEKGAQCGGHCCTNSTENELKKIASADFERSLHHHTKSLRGVLESTAKHFQSYILDSTDQSGNRTINVFSQVYIRMLPLSRKLIEQLYSDIKSTIKATESTTSINTLEHNIHQFFVNLFPVAYHQVVHLDKQRYGELHEDYINCLKLTYDEIQPFGDIPTEISRNLRQSIQMVHILINALHQSAEVLGETDELYGAHLTESCQKHLLRMSYCPRCNGLQKTHVKTCYGYCVNVLRGCSAQYAGALDSHWSSVASGLENLMNVHMGADAGIVAAIKQLDVKLPDSIMKAMGNGPELEKTVKKACGTPKLLPSKEADNEIKKPISHYNKKLNPVEPELLHFSSTIDKSKDFYSNIVNNVCDDDEFQRNDRHCWIGDRISDYDQIVMTPGQDTQRYNPEVPYEPTSKPTKLHELLDKLLKIRKNLDTAMPSPPRTINDIQSDMAGHDDEGSGHITDDVDDEEYRLQGSGDGSGDGATSFPVDPRSDNNEDNEITPHESSNSPASTVSSAMSLVYLTCLLLVTHHTLLATIRFYKLNLN